MTQSEIDEMGNINLVNLITSIQLKLDFIIIYGRTNCDVGKNKFPKKNFFLR